MSVSKFLPKDYTENSKITILAGRGEYPIICAKNILKSNKNLSIIMLDDYANKSDFNMIDSENLFIINIGQIRKLFNILQNIHTEYAVMAGQIQPKKLFHGLNPDITAIMLLAKLKQRNAETIFGTIAFEIEKFGTRVLDARSFMDNDIASQGTMVETNKKIKQEYMEHGIFIAKEISKLNIGQSVLVKNGTVLCVEGYDGTNKMISRASDFNLDDAIFIKTSKPKQDFRFDVPVFGDITIELLHNVGIKHVLLEADSVIMLNKHKLLKTAKKYGISIYGF